LEGVVDQGSCPVGHLGLAGGEQQPAHYARGVVGPMDQPELGTGFDHDTTKNPLPTRISSTSTLCSSCLEYTHNLSRRIIRTAQSVPDTYIFNHIVTCILAFYKFSVLPGQESPFPAILSESTALGRSRVCCWLAHRICQIAEKTSPRLFDYRTSNESCCWGELVCCMQALIRTQWATLQCAYS
jgi:hypothetical protein